MSKLLTYGGHYIHTHGGYFGADTVTGQHCNLKIHIFCCYGTQITRILRDYRDLFFNA